MLMGDSQQRFYINVIWPGFLNGVDTFFLSPTGGIQKLTKGPFFKIVIPSKKGAGFAYSEIITAKLIRFLKST